jgi:hypothetical protein
MSSRLHDTSYLSPFFRGGDAYSTKRKQVMQVLEQRGVWPDTMIEVGIGMYQLDIFGHVSGPNLASIVHGSLDRAGTFVFERALGVEGARGLCTGKGPITVLPLRIVQQFRLPVSWPDTVMVVSDSSVLRRIPPLSKSHQFPDILLFCRVLDHCLSTKNRVPLGKSSCCSACAPARCATVIPSLKPSLTSRKVERRFIRVN